MDIKDIKLENEDLDLSIVKEECSYQEDNSCDAQDQDTQVEGPEDHKTVAKPDTEFTLMYACPYCDRVFTAIFYYERHIFIAHPHLNPFVCKQCQRSFKNETDLTNHVCYVSVRNMSKKMKRKIFSCGVCPRMYPTKALLKQHDLLRHSGEHVCVNCKFIFNNAKMKYFEYLKKCSCGPVDKTQKNLICSICKRIFSRMQSLKNHVKIHEDNKIATAAQKKCQLTYKCDRCPQSFPGTQALIDHIRAEHSGSLQCPKCTFLFFTQYELNLHLAEHRNMPFSCKGCNRLFKYEDTMKNHIKNYHKQLCNSDSSSESNNE